MWSVIASLVYSVCMGSQRAFIVYVHVCGRMCSLSIYEKGGLRVSSCTLDCLPLCRCVCGPRPDRWGPTLPSAWMLISVSSH